MRPGRFACLSFGLALASAAVFLLGSNADTSPTRGMPTDRVTIAVDSKPTFMLASVTPVLPGISTAVAAPAYDVARISLPAVAGPSEWFNHFERSAPAVAVLDADNSRFGHAAGSDTAASQRIAHLFAQSKSRASTASIQVAMAEPSAARFAGTPVSLEASERIALAYADPSPAPMTGALAAISAIAPSDDDTLALSDPGDESSDDDLLLPDDAVLSEDGSLPEAGPLPVVRPRVERPDVPSVVEKRSKEPKRQKLAYARPDEPVDDGPGTAIGRGLRNLFGGGARAGNGVAVYDISAETVYMPDGSRLEAHSGIGKMADNPRYVHVKMNGPTPPHTYNLRMRETRFHGVEAIRMIPVDGKNPHGRTGLLTHSYLLRGGRAESHGCVAFKDYKRFLTAFKKGHVKQLVVVSSGGRAVARSAKKGRDA